MRKINIMCALSRCNNGLLLTKLCQESGDSKRIPSQGMTQEIRTNRRNSKVEWPTVALIAACYAMWAATGLMVWQELPALALIILGFVLALQSSLIHEAVHGHPTRKAWVNEILMGLPVGLVYPFRRFKALHLRHHADERLTDPFEDPETYYLALWQHEELPGPMKWLLRINNTLAGRFVLGPVLGTAGFLISEARLIAEGDRAVREAWLIHGAGLAIVIPLVTVVFGIPLWLYIIVPVWLGQSLIAVRTFAEHQWSELPDGRTIIVERSPLSILFLNNNLHLVHHKMPTVAWYRLPRLFREGREEWVRMNRGYVFPNYLALLRAFAFKAKEPVVHPVLRREAERGRAFRPPLFVPSGQGAAEVPAPAEPSKE